MTSSVFPVPDWLVKNLSELKIWVEYCSLPRINTLQFHEHVIRDLVDIDMKIGGLDKTDCR